MRHSKIDIIKAYFSKLKSKLIKEKNNNSRLLLSKIENKNSLKKRKAINIRINFEYYLKFFKKNYIPYYFIICIIFLIILLFLIFWPLLRVKYIEIIKKDNITNMNIAYKAVDNIRNEKIFKINELDTFNKLKSYQDNIKSIDLKIVFPNTIKIEVESYKEVFNININWIDYILVENWTIIPWNHSKNLKFINIIKNIDKNKFIEYKKIFNPFYIEKINNIISKLEENIINIKIKNLYYYDVERELHIEIENGNILIFSIDDDIEPLEQIEKLVIFNKDYSSITDNKIIYIDLRIKNKIFYCPIESEYQCNENIKSIYNK